MPKPYEIIIPDNDYGVAPGYYDWRGLVALLRKHCADAKAVHFLADMME